MAVETHRPPPHQRALTVVDRWVVTRKVVQVLALLAFLVLIVFSRRSTAAPEWINLPLRLDPLLVLANLFASRTFLAGSLAALSIVLLTLLAGRAWCGWLCPLGTLLDLFSVKRLRRGQKVPPESWRTIKYGLLFILLLSALFGSLALLILDPITIVYRSFTLAVLPALDHLVMALETALYPIPFLSKAVLAFDGWIRPSLLPANPIYYREAWLFAVVLAGIILLNRVAPRFWCRYLCPLGAMLGLISKISLFRRQVDADCRQCGVCDHACPTGTIDRDKGYISDPAECTFCLECFQSCPRSTLRIAPHFRPAPHFTYDPGRREFLAALGVSAASVALLQRDANAGYSHQFLLRPPGAGEQHLLQTCLRCGACLAACPTSALQPAITEAGLSGLWTPVVVPRMGYCDYSCTACGNVCPVQAIPPLTLDEKRQQVIGKAYIDQDRCIAWSDLQDCIICEEMCPVPDKAIHLEHSEVLGPDGQMVTVLLPFVERERCIGCGICENKCPLGGESAIQVHIDNQPVF